ncbi:FG-GAP-like repeat-containing protein [Aeoliella sp. ICT_H6.2]|uniref:FG-GAP-like repeat-containing protein n=1 Tax=Aeoliella straminimaris TaxID=2954799 RepID=A0A9X2FC80_9BACT|nr:choice-of-anchor Q domain-containing protein [Aeoliella straminimaris]MCO6045924.1 FG-GAP-like repeat-containing protein [Aeoliella straminimaris]
MAGRDRMWQQGAKPGRRRGEQATLSPSRRMNFEVLEDRRLLAVDFGDAPDQGVGTGPLDYQTLAIDGGPQHAIIAGLHIGATVDAEDGLLQGLLADADDIDSALPDDEDGVARPLRSLVLTTGTVPRVGLWVTNTTGVAATLYGWIDYNGDGLFDSAAERAFIVIPDGTVAQMATLEFPAVPLDAVQSTYARFRLSTDAAASAPTGAASDGEVEDYRVSILRPTDGSVDPSATIEIGGGSQGLLLEEADYFGGSTANIGDLDGDGVVDVAVGATGDDTGGQRSGAVYVLFMNPDGTVKSHSKIAHNTGGGPSLSSYDQFGRSIAAVGDLNGDGIVDLAIGANNDRTGGASRGAVYILLMNSDGTVGSTTKIASGLNGAPPLANNDRFGWAVTPLGDFDGDGIDDLAVGSLTDSTGGSDRGAVHLLMLNSDGSVKNFQKIASNVGGGPALANGDYFGRSMVAVGDLNGDQTTELVVGAVLDDTGGTNRGALYVLYLEQDGTVATYTKIASNLNGGPALNDGDSFGFAVDAIGDADGDGIVDLAVGAAYDDTAGIDRGAVYLLSLHEDGSVGVINKVASGISGGPVLPDGHNFGSGVSSLGDLNGDGVMDLIVSGELSDLGGTNSGAAHVLFLNDANAPPVFSSVNSVSVPENSTAVLSVTATDKDLPQQVVSFSLAGGADAGMFEISRGGDLVFLTAPDFDVPADVNGNNVYEVTVEASDGAGGVAQQAIEVTVTSTIAIDTLVDEADGSIVDGDISLRDAIALAPADTTISFAVNGVIELNSVLGELVIDSDRNIVGPGSGLLTIDAGNGLDGVSSTADGFRVLRIDDGDAGNMSQVRLEGLTLTGGDLPVAQNGGGLLSRESLTLADVVLSDNYASNDGGAIYSSGGSLLLQRSRITGNIANQSGGGLAIVAGDADLQTTTIDANTAHGNGGGIYARSVNTAIEATTISGNTADNSGGGVFFFDDTFSMVYQLHVDQSTVSGNVAGAGGTNYAAGGVHVLSGRGHIEHSTITANSSPGGIGIVGGVASGLVQARTEVYSTIIAGNINGDVGSATVNTIQSLGYNLIGIGNGVGRFNQPGDQTGVMDPVLAPLADNGGPTLTHRLGINSPAIDAGESDVLPGSDGLAWHDQRGAGFPRLRGASIDIGAYELSIEPPSSLVVSTIDDEFDAVYDPGDLSLREAVGWANLLPGTQTINFDPVVFADPRTIDLDLGELQITDSVSIVGPGRDRLVIDAHEASRIFRIADGDEQLVQRVTLSDLSITGGAVVGSGGGLLTTETLLLNNIAITDSMASDQGGGLFIDLDGGATFSLTTGRISGNEAAQGGGVYIASMETSDAATSRVKIDSSTIDQNSAMQGGGLANRGRLVFENSTVSGNSATSGSGIFNDDGDLTVRYATIVDALSNSTGTVSIENTIVTDAVGALQSKYSLIQVFDDAVLVDGGGNILGVDPNLDPLADNGGANPTHALRFGSPAVDAGNPDPTNPPQFDQRGIGYQRQFDELTEVARPS